MKPTHLRNTLWMDESSGRPEDRRGAFLPMALFCLAPCMMFAAFSIDIGLISLTQTRLQNAVDAAALAAAMEITHAIENADANVANVLLFAREQAKAKAVEVAALNGVYVDPERDVEFGLRLYDEASGAWVVQWGASPPNVVKVIARRDNEDISAPDGKLPLAFAGVYGDGTATLQTNAVAYVESRDIVTVLDFSRSMNFDSYFAEEYEDPNSQLPQVEIEANMYKIWEDLGFPAIGNMPWQPDWVTIPGQPASGPVPHIDVTWRSSAIDVVSTKDLSNVVLQYSNGATQKFEGLSGTTGTFQGTGSNAGKRIIRCWIKSGQNQSGDGPGYGELFDFYDNDTIKRGLGLDGVPYPWPVGSWDRYIEMARDHSSSMTPYYQYEIYAKGYRRKFGVMTFIHYVMKFESGHWETPDLWMTRHYPFHSVKEGHELFCNFLADLNFGDHSGLVSYDTSHRVEDGLNEIGMPYVNISAEPITDDYASLVTIMQHKQAAHYSYATNMGGGITDAKWLLDNHGRIGARPTILLMTDGNTNTMDQGESSTLPVDWNWNELLDYNGDGIGDYYTGSNQKRYALKKAKEAVDAGYTIHTMSVGVDADRDLMQAIAFLGGGIWVDVPGGTTIAEMEADMLEAFRRIAAFVPPARLMRDGS